MAAVESSRVANSRSGRVSTLASAAIRPQAQRGVDRQRWVYVHTRAPPPLRPDRVANATARACTAR